MPAQHASSRAVDAYIAGFPPDVQKILRRVRREVLRAAPAAAEIISYRMPALRQDGMLVYYAAFKAHIGLFPPVRGDARLVKAAAKYAGPKGSLKFPYDQPMPLHLIARIVKHRVKENQLKAARRKLAPKRPEAADRR